MAKGNYISYVILPRSVFGAVILSFILPNYFILSFRSIFINFNANVGKPRTCCLSLPKEFPCSCSYKITPWGFAGNQLPNGTWTGMMARFADGVSVGKGIRSQALQQILQLLLLT